MTQDAGEAALDAPVAAGSESAEAAIEAPQGVSMVWHYRGLALMAADFVIVAASFLVAYYLRFQWQFMAIKYATSDSVIAYLKGAILLGAVWVFFIWRAGGYESGVRGIATPIVRMRSVLTNGLKALVVLMVISYMYRDMMLSRQVYLMSGVFACAAMILLRTLFRELDRDLAAHELALQRVALVGLDAQTAEFAERLARARSTVKVSGFITANGEETTGSFSGLPVLGRLDELHDLYERHPFEKLILSHSTVSNTAGPASAERMIAIVNFCEARGISLYTLPNVLNVAVSQNEVGTFHGMAVVKLRDAALHRGYAIIKRVMDLALAVLIVIAGAPLWIAIALLVKLTSKGPFFFTQTRIGLHGEPFTIYKFRSMVVDAEARLKELVDIDKLDVPGFKIKGDPRVTRVGRFLRRTSLDEIPQLINVLKGEMSLVGPRPELPDLVARYNAWQRRRLKAKPGITGYQQVMARGMPLAAAIEYDLIYLKHQSLLLDLFIMCKTVQVVLFGRGVTH